MFLFVDTETTGFASGGVQPRVVSIAWMISDRPDKPRVFKRAIVRPVDFEIPSAAQAVHGISTEKARREGVSLKSVLDDLTLDIRTIRPSYLVAHNLAYDRPIVEAEYSRIGNSPPLGTLAAECTMLMARRRWPGESAKLSDVYRRLFKNEMRNAHDASGDVWACAQIFFALRSYGN